MDFTLIPGYLAAVGALGTAATGLVDTTKFFNGGLSRSGYKTIVTSLALFKPMLDPIPRGCAWDIIYGLWINGVPLDDQKAKVKALIMLGFNADKAQDMANATGLSKDQLKSLADGTSNAVAVRLDAILDALLDGAYEKADQQYRNATKAAAALVAVTLSVIGFRVTAGAFDGAVAVKAILVGLVATPLAPVVKDLTTAINNSAQAAGQLKSLIKA